MHLFWDINSMGGMHIEDYSHKRCFVSSPSLVWGEDSCKLYAEHHEEPLIAGRKPMPGAPAEALTHEHLGGQGTLPLSPGGCRCSGKGVGGLCSFWH